MSQREFGILHFYAGKVSVNMDVLVLRLYAGKEEWVAVIIPHYHVNMPGEPLYESLQGECGTKIAQVEQPFAFLSLDLLQRGSEVIQAVMYVT